MRGQTDDLDVAFRKYHADLCLSRAKVALIVGILVVPFFSGLDYVFARDHFRLFLIMRLATVLEAGTMLALLFGYRTLGLKLSSFFVSFYCLTVGLMLTTMCFKLGGFNSTYYVGIILVILGATVVMPWHPAYHLFGLGGMHVIYLSQIFLVGINAPWGTFISNNYFLFGALAMTFVGTVLQYRMHFLLKQKDEYKNYFLANISHELKTPMTLVLAPLESAGAEAPPEAPQVTVARSEFEAIRHNAYRLSELINDLLDLTKSEVGKARISPVEIQDTRGYFEGIFRSVAPLMKEKGLTSSFDSVEGLAPHFFDRSRLDKVVVNLLSNAIKFTPKGGKITMRLWDEAPVSPAGAAKRPVLKFSVEDTGIGIPQDQLPFIFERFMQVDASSTRAYGGMGIGLSLVKDFVEQHGGVVTVTSTEGQGTCFTASLPRGREHLKALITEAVEGSPPPAATRLEVLRETAWEAEAEEVPVSGASEDRDLVLIVDDTPDMRHAVREILKSQYRVLAAADGEEGIRVARERRPDLIIADVMMPRMDGYGLLAEIRADPELRETPVIFLTAKGGEENLARGFQAGSDDYIPKPFQPKEVLSRVGNLLRLRRQKVLLEEINRRLVETQAELVQAEKLSSVGVLAAGMAHELNNPVGAIRNYIQLLLEEVPKATETWEILKGMEKATSRCKRIVNDLLTFSREAKDLRSFDLNLLVGKCVGNAQREVVRPGIEIVTRLTPQLAQAKADQLQIEQVLNNLIANAADAIPDRGTITLQTGVEGETLTFSVQDSGLGIPEEILPKIFDPFFTTKLPGKGMGLGLAICYNIVSRCGGKIEVKTEKGKGTTFVVRLPADIQKGGIGHVDEGSHSLGGGQEDAASVG